MLSVAHALPSAALLRSSNWEVSRPHVACRVKVIQLVATGAAALPLLLHLKCALVRLSVSTVLLPSVLLLPACALCQSIQPRTARPCCVEGRVDNSTTQPHRLIRQQATLTMALASAARRTNTPHSPQTIMHPETTCFVASSEGTTALVCSSAVVAQRASYLEQGLDQALYELVAFNSRCGSVMQCPRRGSARSRMRDATVVHWVGLPRR